VPIECVDFIHFHSLCLSGGEFMLTPSKADCIAVLSAASRAANANDRVRLNCTTLGLSRNSLDATAAFLMERDCFVRCQGAQGSYEVGGLSLQGKLRLEQLVHG
jgi:hypothetical protein